MFYGGGGVGGGGRFFGLLLLFFFKQLSIDSGIYAQCMVIHMKTLYNFFRS